VRVFPDTNVLAGAFGTRGLCADVLRLVLAEHELLTGEIVIQELRRVLRSKFRVPLPAIGEIESFLRGYHVEPKPRELLNLPLRDRNDVVVVTSAVQARADILISGDREVLDLGSVEGLAVKNPRAFWKLVSA
jgi:putative PIN family toxin of toxin-antitoxin system